MNTCQENFYKLFNSINDFVFILDLDTNIIEVNDSIVKFLGYKRQDLKGKSIINVYPLQYREILSRNIRKVVVGVREACSLPLLSKENKEIPVETKIFMGKWDNKAAYICVGRNLSEIALSEEKFYLVFEKSQSIMAISEIDSGVFINVNRQFLETLGYKRSEIIGSSSQELELFYDYNDRARLVNELIKNSEVTCDNVLIRKKDGAYIYVVISMSILNIKDKKYILTSATDISRLKTQEKTIKTNLNRQSILADISQNFLSLDDFNGKISHTIEVLGKHTDVSRVYIFEDNALGAAMSNTFEWCNHGISAQIDSLQDVPYEIIPSWKDMLVKEGKIFSKNIYELPDDIISILAPQDIKSILVFPLYVKNEFFGFIGFDECINEKEWEFDEVELLRTVSGIISNSYERLIYQNQLAESELRMKLAIENTEAGLWDWNIKTGEVVFNDIWCNMIGYNREEIEPNVKSWEKLVNPEDMPIVEKSLNDHLEGRSEKYMAVHRLLTKSGDWKWILDKGKVVEYDSDNKPVRAIGTHIDIDHQKKTEVELQKLNMTKDKFFSIISHDLRGPIGTMMQISEMVSEKGTLDEDTLYDFLNSQKELSQSTFQLLENLLSWARFSQGQINYKPKKNNLNGIVEEIITTVKYNARQKGIDLIIDIKEPVSVFADEDMVKLIIRNLLNNALKFTGSGGSIKIESVLGPKYVEVKIKDTGVGITQENIDKILDEKQFYSTRGTSNEIGTGLGLNLCKNFIAKNKGEFRITSKINEGTTFSFTLPLA